MDLRTKAESRNLRQEQECSRVIRYVLLNTVMNPAGSVKYLEVVLDATLTCKQSKKKEDS
jgi:hypothetical protein